MNTNILKRFAKDARIKLLDQVGRKLEFVLTHDTAELRGKQKEIEQLKKKIAEQGKEQVIEMVAYTWFNRLMALRFMDANGYTIPKVITPLEGMTNPEVLQNALGGNIESELKLDRQRLNDLLDGKTAATDAHTEAYKMMLVSSCNQWHMAMPFMFERISDYTELLLPDDLLSDYGIVADIRNGMSDEDCQEEELIGWLYQFYIADKKDDVFEGLKKNIKITAENIPAATQLFTPRWIVRYMVENTLGKLWLTLKPNSKLRQHMPYYIEAPEGNAPAPLPEGIKGVTDITFLDPCQGSGHVLAYAFDLFTKIYEEEGYNTNEIPALILEHNLFGIDIDERAAQLAAFALTMKARSYYPRFLRKPMQPHVTALENVNEDIIKQAVKLPLAVAGKFVYDYRDLTLYNFTQADNFGSLIQIDPEELKALQIQKGSIWQEQEQKLKEQAEYLSRKYHCVVTNPPYMGYKFYGSILSDFMDLYYPNTKSDMFAAFMEVEISLLEKNGFGGIINQWSWMCLPTYKNFRIWLLENLQLENLLHLGIGVFPELNSKKVQSVAFTFSNSEVKSKSTFFKLDESFDTNVKQEKLQKRQNKYVVAQRDLLKIKDAPIAFWLSHKVIESYDDKFLLENILTPRQGLATSDNARFLRHWTEVSQHKVCYNAQNQKDASLSLAKYFPYNKGGSFRRWYGNQEYLINWENEGKEVIAYAASLYGSASRTIKNVQFYFRDCLTWGQISLQFNARISPGGFIFDVSGSCGFPKKENELLCLSFLNSKISSYLLDALNFTLNVQVGDIKRLLFIFPDAGLKNKIDELTKECIDISKLDWDRRENSWGFQKLPLFEKEVINNDLRTGIQSLKKKFEQDYLRLFHNEIELNKCFIDLYDLRGVIEPEFKLKDVTILQNELDRSLIIDNSRLGLAPFNEIELLIQLFSYSVGCMLGRYSLDVSGLILANQGETLQDFLNKITKPSFLPDEDNIIPVLEGEWFTDDIIGRFKVFLKAAFSEAHFEENLKYIEDTISKDIRKYFVKDFYNDHIKRYKKRPIYWMFSSPKGYFKALIYMHRYQPDLCSKMLNDYLQAFISKLEAAKQTQTMLSLREDISAREKTIAIKEIDKYEAMLKDCRDYEKTLFTIATQKISIDLDDGVKVNYQKFKEVLVPIKGLEKEEE